MMSGTPSFMDMAGNYKERLVANYTNKNNDRIQVDTAAISDSDQPYETGIIHPGYNDGDWIIVEVYDTIKEAKVGHKRWVKKMTARSLPNQLLDVSTAEIAILFDTFGDDWRLNEYPAHGRTTDKER